MPELPEVETVRRGLEDRLANFQIKRVEVCRERAIASEGGSKKFVQMLKDAYFGNWLRRGKYLIADLHNESPSSLFKTEAFPQKGYLGVHLRMTGHFQLHDSPSSPCSHTRVRIWGLQNQELRFVDTRSFGQMWWVPPGEKIETIIKGLGKLGPEPFSKSFNAKYLQNRLKRSKRPIKSALLDQSLVAGAGNIYSDESLFLAGILPQTPSCKLNLNQIEKLCSSLIETLRISIGEGGTTFSDFRDLEGINGNYGGQAWVYGRAKQPCRLCGEYIAKGKLGGRSTHWCPSCQH